MSEIILKTGKRRTSASAAAIAAAVERAYSSKSGEPSGKNAAQKKNQSNTGKLRDTQKFRH